MITLAILAVIVRVTTPILLSGIGTLYNDRAGVTNITVEGSMLLGAFASVACSYFTHNWVLSVLVAVLCGILVSLLFSLLTTVLNGVEIIVGLAMNVFLDGLTVFLLRQVFKQSGSLYSPEIVGIPTFSFEGLNNIPVLNECLNGQTWIVYFAFLSVVLSQIVLFHTPFGMKVRACGENPNAAATVGINVPRIRLICNIIAGSMCGLAGAQLSLGFLSLFSEGMTVGKGYIALAAVIFSKGKPARVLSLSLFFGLAEALSNTLQLTAIPPELALMLPYVTVILLTLLEFKKKPSAHHPAN
ncbi:ABC transporter permease [uncultured Oscillibacter sp.]|uniref:ABC transporter permease n=1 Tax=uncultured Oscillibacter sp. TaxID=876091 RepID=UPI00280409A7|nr:ABC transporter permease [uncultured Oscillibacter sp.]